MRLPFAGGRDIGGRTGARQASARRFPAGQALPVAEASLRSRTTLK